MRDASDIAVDPTSATAEATSGSPAASSPVEETPAVGDVVFERSPTAAAAPTAAPAVDQQGSKRPPSRFSMRKHKDRQHSGDLPDGAADSAVAAPPGSAAEPLDTASTPEQREGSGGSSRKRRQQQEGPSDEEAADAEAEAIWATASTPRTAAQGPAGSKAAAGGERGRPPRPQPLLADTVSERLPGHLGSSVVQQAAALADLAGAPPAHHAECRRLDVSTSPACAILQHPCGGSHLAISICPHDLAWLMTSAMTLERRCMTLSFVWRALHCGCTSILLSCTAVGCLPPSA